MWILPTYDRPEQCAVVLSRLVEMKCSTPGVVFVNGKEKEKEYWDLCWPQTPDGWVIESSEENIGALGALNKVFELHPNESWYGFIADDEFVETEEFDKKLIAAAGDWNIAHGDDGFNGGQRFQGGCVVGGELARTVGYLALRETWHWYGFDSMWESLAQTGACRRVFVPEVKVDHRHPFQGKGELDKCYELGLSRKDIDQQIYFHWLRYEIGSTAKRVKKAKGFV